MSKKIVFGCWSNDLHVIAEAGQAGVIHGRVFTNEANSRAFYSDRCSPVDGDRIIRITVEDLGPVFQPALSQPEKQS